MVRVSEVGPRDVGVFEDTMTEGMDSSCEWDEVELAMLWTSASGVGRSTSLS